MSFNELIGL